MMNRRTFAGAVAGVVTGGGGVAAGRLKAPSAPPPEAVPAARNVFGSVSWRDAAASTPMADIAAMCNGAERWGGPAQPDGAIGTLLITPETAGLLADNKNPADLGGVIDDMLSRKASSSRLGCVERLFKDGGLYLLIVPGDTALRDIRPRGEDMIVVRDDTVILATFRDDYHGMPNVVFDDHAPYDKQLPGRLRHHLDVSRTHARSGL